MKTVSIDVDDYLNSELKDMLNEIKKERKEQIPQMVSNEDYGFEQDELYEYLKNI